MTVGLLMTNHGQSTLCSSSSRLADDSSRDVCSQSETPSLAYKEAKNMTLGVFIPPPDSALWKTDFVSLVGKILKGPGKPH